MCFDYCCKEGCSPNGVIITDEILQSCSPELREAWETFSSGFQILEDLYLPCLIDRRAIPNNMAEAMALILDERIPFQVPIIKGGFSCFMMKAIAKMTPG